MAIFIAVVVILIVGIAALVFLRRNWSGVNQDQKRLHWLASQQYVLLMIQVPRNNDKTPLSAEQMFASLHGIYQAAAQFQDHLSFEIVAHGNSIKFYVYTPVHLRDFVEGQIYAQYPSVEIIKVEDYSRKIDLAQEHIVGCELEMTKPDVYPIKTFVNFNVDPLSGITSTLASLGDDEQVWIEILLKPVDDSWQLRGTEMIKSIREPGPKQRSIIGHVASGMATIAGDVFRQATIPSTLKPAEAEEKKKEEKLPGAVESALKGIEEKITKLGFATKIRIGVVTKDVYSAQSKMLGVVGAFKQFNTTNLNGFAASQLMADDHEFWDKYASRSFEDKGLVLNIEELASLYHLPNMTVETPNIAWTTAKKGEPPATLPISGIVPADQLTVFGRTNFRNIEKDFGIKLPDRRRHMYIIGKSGTGKSTLMENMIVDDIREGRGVILVDPHGEFYEHTLASIPEHRIKDVILFDPSDREFPVGFNLLESVHEDLKGIVTSGFVGILEKMFSNSWGPRLEHILRNTVLALLDYPDSTMLGIPKMLTEKKYRAMVVEQVKDPVIRDFWENEFASWDQKFASEAVAPILNKVGQFISTPTIRNIVGQVKSTFDMREAMDQGKIVLINLSRGKIGEDNSAMLGAMIITKIQLAAMSRADVPEEKRVDSYLYVDEFQNFATKSFATILSEARKYRLNLTMANQYIAQMPDEVRDAVFGNVGTMITFRVGASDAAELVKEYTPVFIETDLVNQDIYKIYVKISIDGITGQAFSANTFPPHNPEKSYAADIINFTHSQYSRSRAEVERVIFETAAGDSPAKEKPANLDSIELPAIKIRQENIVNGNYYKEFNSPGGGRWWEGEPIEAVLNAEEEKRKKFITKKSEQLRSNTTLSDTKIIPDKKFEAVGDVAKNEPEQGSASGEGVQIKNVATIDDAMENELNQEPILEDSDNSSKNDTIDKLDESDDVKTNQAQTMPAADKPLPPEPTQAQNLLEAPTSPVALLEDQMHGSSILDRFLPAGDGATDDLQASGGDDHQGKDKQPVATGHKADLDELIEGQAYTL